MTRSNSCKFTKEGEARSDWVNLDALQSTALRSAMMWLLRKSATLIAVYSIALQALIWGFVPPGHFQL